MPMLNTVHRTSCASWSLRLCPGRGERSGIGTASNISAALRGAAIMAQTHSDIREMTRGFGPRQITTGILVVPRRLLQREDLRKHLCTQLFAVRGHAVRGDQPVSTGSMRVEMKGSRGDRCKCCKQSSRFGSSSLPELNIREPASWRSTGKHGLSLTLIHVHAAPKLTK